MVRPLHRAGRLLSVRRVALLALLLLAPGVAAAVRAASSTGPRSFPSAEAAAAALDAAVQANDVKALLGIFGPAGKSLVVSGDPVADAAARKRFAQSYAEAHTLAAAGEGRMVLTVGANGWSMPIPLVETDNTWHFDATVGSQDIIDRRIGRNELMTIRTLLAVVAAQKDYFDRLQRGAGTGAYAERFLSTPGSQDGLYWPAGAGEAVSPLGPLIAQVESEGYPGATGTHGRRTPYQGYFYRMLMAQGPDAPGGAKSYLQDGRMTGGFALVAWPASYASSGIMTFVVDQDGVVFQKNLGVETAKDAAAMRSFDPDETWARVDLSD